MPVDLKLLKETYERLKVRRALWDRLWQEIADFMVPWRNTITSTVTPGTKLTDRIFDSTAPQALTTAASAVHGSVTPSTLRWFSITVADPDLLDEPGVAIWLDDISNRVFEAISNSNFDSEAQEVYSDLLAFGTGCMYVEEATAQRGTAFSGVRFHAQQPGTFVVAEGPDGRVDTVMREVVMTVAAAERRWGADALSEQSQKLLRDNRGDTKLIILQAVAPRLDGTVGSPSPRRMPVASVWCEMGPTETAGGQSSVTQYGNLHSIVESGFPEMPLMVSRWRKMSGEEYGRSPGMNVLPDVRTINQAVELRLKAWVLAVAPPIVTTDRGVIGNVILRPFGRTIIRPGATLEPLNIPARFDVANFQEEQLRQTIRAGFFVDLLQFTGKPGTPISATEAAIRFQSMQRILGPVVARLQSELLAPLVTRVLQIMGRRRVLPPPPEALRALNPVLELIFEGPLARVQRAADVEAVNQFFSLTFPLAEVNRDVLVRVDFDEVLDILAQATSLPARALRSKAEADAIRFQQRQQEAQQLVQQNLIQAAEVFQRGVSQGGPTL